MKLQLLAHGSFLFVNCIRYHTISYHVLYCRYNVFTCNYSLSDVWSLLLPLAICATTYFLVRQFAWAEVDGYLQLRGTEEQRANDGCFAAAGWVPNAVDHIHDGPSLARSRALNGYFIIFIAFPTNTTLQDFTRFYKYISARFSEILRVARCISWISIPGLDSTSVRNAVRYYHHALDCRVTVHLRND